MKSDKLGIDKHFLLNITYKTHKMNNVDSPSNSIDKVNTEYQNKS